MRTKYSPDEAYLIGDNEEAMKLITDQNLLGTMKPVSGANTCYFHFETEHHWCQASYHEGHEKEHDNGYAVFMVPKSKWDKARAEKFFSNVVSETSEIVTFRWMERGPLKNN